MCLVPRNITQPWRVKRRSRRRRATTYVAVLGTSLIVAALTMGGILITRARGRIVSEVNDAAAARQHAESAMELARLWIRQDSEWRFNRPHGAWVTNQPIGDGAYSLAVTDPADASLSNRPLDPVHLKVTATKGLARHIAQVTLQAKPVQIRALDFALHTGGEVHVLGQLTCSPAQVSTNGSLLNEGQIDGGIHVSAVTNLGTVTGTQTIGAEPKDFPAPDVVDKYVGLGTSINPPATIEVLTVSPMDNPWGATNPDGLYVIRPVGDLTIRNARIYGTLVILCPPGGKVVIDNNVLIHPYRADYPTLIIRGNAELAYFSHTDLDEKIFSFSFNKNAPYDGSTNGNRNEKYPSEIQGLVHVIGSVTMKQTARIRGALLCESNAAADAVRIEDTPTIVYTPSLSTSPPNWYTVDVPMPVQPGSWRQLAN
jgi:hypothetical protein